MIKTLFTEISSLTEEMEYLLQSGYSHTRHYTYLLKKIKYITKLYNKLCRLEVKHR